MKIKTFLLAGATVLAAGVSAQAADLGAEPANYVKVCDAFGKGYYYAPGTDTCIRIGGYVRFEVRGLQFSPAQPLATNWKYVTEAAVNVTASSMTEYGPLIGYIQILASSSSTLADGKPGAGVNALAGAVVDDAWLSLGPLLAGYTWSIFQTYEAPVFNNSNYRNFSGRTRLNQVRLTWKSGDFGFGLAAEDYSGRIPANVTNVPDITAAIDGKVAGIGLHLGAGYGARGAGNTWGVNGTASVGLDALSKGSVLAVGANYSAGGDDWIGSYNTSPAPTITPGMNYYSVYGHFLYFWNSQFSTAIAGAYRSGATTRTEFTLNGTFRPVTGFAVGADIDAVSSGGAAYVVSGRVRLQRSFP